MLLLITYDTVESQPRSHAGSRNLVSSWFFWSTRHASRAFPYAVLEVQLSRRQRYVLRAKVMRVLMEAHSAQWTTDPLANEWSEDIANISFFMGIYTSFALGCYRAGTGVG